MLLALPAVLLVVWASQSVGHGDTATIDITAENPTQLRSGVISRMALLGGVRVGEDSSFTGSGSSDLRFSIPTAHLEDALDALGSLGGRVTDQQVDLSGSASDARSVQTGLDRTKQCIDDVSTSAGSSAVSAQINQCLASVDQVSQQFDQSSVDLANSQLQVRIHPAEHSNPILVTAIVVLLLAAGGLTVMVWRSSRASTEVDLRGVGEFQDFDGEGFMRRN
jgi:hypothetical protein